MNYKIEKIKETSKNFEGIIGMVVLTYVSPVTKKKYIDGPTNIKEYDKYYEWLRNETNYWAISSSENLEDFKRQFIETEGEFIPVASIDDLEELETPTQNYIIETYNKNFNEYFREAKKQIKQ